MADTNTTNYALVKPEVGASANSWGDKLNADMDAIDTALSGIALKTRAHLSTVGSSATFSVSAGYTVDSTGALIKRASPISKTTSAWAVGTNQGGLGNGLTIANNTWYDAYMIKRVDTGVVDVICCLASTVLTLPTNYTLSGLLGSMKTDGSAQWKTFTQVGNRFIWAVPVKELDTGAATAAGQYTLSLTGVPNAQVIARLRGLLANTTVGALLNVSSLHETAAAPNATRGNFVAAAQVSGQAVAFGGLDVVTGGAGSIRYAVDTGSSDIALDVYEWIDLRLT